jgi:hypothetical protein
MLGFMSGWGFYELYTYYYYGPHNWLSEGH